MDLFQTTCFSHAVSLDDVFEEGNDGFFRQPRVEKNRSTVFGKAFFTNQAIQQSGVGRTVCGADSDIILTPNTVFGAVFILAAKVFQVVHDCSPEIKVLDTTNVSETSRKYQISKNVSILIDHQEKKGGCFWQLGEPGSGKKGIFLDYTAEYGPFFRRCCMRVVIFANCLLLPDPFLFYELSPRKTRKPHGKFPLKFFPCSFHVFRG